MKYLLAICLFVSTLSLTAQTSYDDITPGRTKEKERTVINTKMEELMKRARFESDCEELKYMVVDTYKFFSNPKRDNLNFPKTIILKGCDQTLTYINLCIPEPEGNARVWAKGTWTLDAARH